jgi:hypothetical protein
MVAAKEVFSEAPLRLGFPAQPDRQTETSAAAEMARNSMKILEKRAGLSACDFLRLWLMTGYFTARFLTVA